MPLQIKDWDNIFEGAKSRGYDNKTSCSMPCKHGLGYRMLIKLGGVECFGAWCALVQVLSRHRKPRKGWLTVDGTRNARPYTSTDLEVLTSIPANVYDKLFSVVTHPSIDWVFSSSNCTDTTGAYADTTGDRQGTLIPLDSDLDSNSNSNSTANAGQLICEGESNKPDNPASSEAITQIDPQFARCWETFERYGVKKTALKYWRKYSKADRDKIEAAIPDYNDAVRSGRPRKQFEGWLNPEHRMWDMDWRKAAEVAREKNAPPKLVNTFHAKTKDKSLLAF
jgi:hypothetical protein